MAINTKLDFPTPVCEYGYLQPIYISISTVQANLHSHTVHIYKHKYAKYATGVQKQNIVEPYSGDHW